MPTNAPSLKISYLIMSDLENIGIVVLNLGVMMLIWKLLCEGLIYETSSNFSSSINFNLYP